RRAAGGPAEQTFAALVGLELRPRRLREAAALWAALTEHRGIAGRDGLWGHPDLLPAEEDFADPNAFARSQLDLGDLDLGSLGDLDPGRSASGEDRPGSSRSDADGTASGESRSGGPDSGEAESGDSDRGGSTTE